MKHVSLHLLHFIQIKLHLPLHASDQARAMSFHRQNNPKYIPPGRKTEIILLYAVCSSAFRPCEKMTQTNNLQGEIFIFDSWFQRLQPMVTGPLALGL